MFTPLNRLNLVSTKKRHELLMRIMLVCFIVVLIFTMLGVSPADDTQHAVINHDTVNQTNAVPEIETPAITNQNALVNLFFAAARIGQLDVLERFLDAGFPVDQRNAQSYTALMVAAYHGQKEATDLLLARGANACIQDKRGNTAIMGALIKGEIQIAKRLYQISCDKTLRNRAGLTLEQFAATYTEGGLDALNKK